MLAHHLGLWLQGRCQKTVFHRGVYTPAETRVCSRTRAAQRSINWDSVFRGKGWICEPTWNAFLTFAHFFTWGIPVIQYVFAIDYPLEQESARRNPTVPYSNWHGTNPQAHVRASNLSHREMHDRKLQIPRPAPAPSDSWLVLSCGIFSEENASVWSGAASVSEESIQSFVATFLVENWTWSSKKSPVPLWKWPMNVSFVIWSI